MTDACFIDPWKPHAGAKAVVYVAVCRDRGTKYVGYTVQPIAWRRSRHAAEAKIGKKKTKFMNAIRKYGIDAFDFCRLQECTDQAEALDIERRIIEAWQPELNITAGGLGAVGYRHSDETRAKMRAARAANLERPTLRGSRDPEIARKAVITRLASGVGFDENGKRVRCIDDGREYKSAVSADRAYGLTRGKVSAVATGTRRSAGGLRFEYVENRSGC